MKDGSIFLHQGNYIKKILIRFNMSDADPVVIPADGHDERCIDMHKTKPVSNQVPYREAIGSLMYLSTGTRPDITFAVNRASRYMEQPQKSTLECSQKNFQVHKGHTIFWTFI